MLVVLFTKSKTLFSNRKHREGITCVLCVLCVLSCVYRHTAVKIFVDKSGCEPLLCRAFSATLPP